MFYDAGGATGFPNNTTHTKLFKWAHPTHSQNPVLEPHRQNSHTSRSIKTVPKVRLFRVRRVQNLPFRFTEDIQRHTTVLVPP